MNPLVPSAADVVFAVAATINLVLVALALVTLASVAGWRHRVTVALFIVLVPFVGPIVSLAAGRRQPARPDAQ